MPSASPQTSRSFTDTEIDTILTHRIAHDAVTEALVCHARNDFVQPLKPYVRPRGRDGEYSAGRYIAMPAFVGGDLNIVGIKWIGSMPANIHRGLPRASGRILLNDPATAREIASMDCATLSARRTAAVVTVCAEHLAPRRPLVVAVIGAGPIGAEVIRALLALRRDIVEVRLFDLCADRAEALLSSIRPGTGVNLRVASSAEACVRGANLIVPATTGGREYLQADWLTRPWLLVALSLDDCTPQLLLGADKVIVDDFDQCNREDKLLHRLVSAGRFSQDQIYAELGQIVSGVKAGREGDENIYVNPMGMAIEDLAVAVRVFRAAALQ